MICEYIFMSWDFRIVWMWSTLIWESISEKYIWEMMFLGSSFCIIFDCWKNIIIIPNIIHLEDEGNIICVHKMLMFMHKRKLIILINTIIIKTWIQLLQINFWDSLCICMHYKTFVILGNFTQYLLICYKQTVLFITCN